MFFYSQTFFTFLLVRATCNWRWVWIIGGMILMFGNRILLERNMSQCHIFHKKISYEIAWDGTQDSAMRDQRFTEENKPKLYIKFEIILFIRRQPVSFPTLHTHFTIQRPDSMCHTGKWSPFVIRIIIKLRVYVKKFRDIYTIRSCAQSNYWIIQS